MVMRSCPTSRKVCRPAAILRSQASKAETSAGVRSPSPGVVASARTSASGAGAAAGVGFLRDFIDYFLSVHVWTQTSSVQDAAVSMVGVASVAIGTDGSYI